jgi:hypothetical protein
MFNPNGGPFDGIVHGLGLLVFGFLWLAALAVTIAILVLLVRFLLVGTRAAKLYIANNSPVTPSEAVIPPSTPPTPTPTTKPGTPKAPPAP